MTESIGGLNVILTADAERMMKDIAAAQAELHRQTEAMKASLDKFQAKTEAQFRPIELWRGAIIGLAAVGFSALIKGALDSASALQDAADRTGVGVEALQAWRFAAAQAGTETKAFDQSLLHFTKNVGDARNGAGGLVDALRTSDRVFLDLLRTAPNMEAALQAAFDKLAGIEDPARRAALASDLFGKEGVKLANILKDGAVNAAELTAELKQTGQILDSETVASAEKAGDALQALGQHVDALKTSVVLGLVPALNNWLDSISRHQKWELPGFQEMVDGAAAKIEELQEKRRRFAQGTPQDSSLLSKLGLANSPRDRVLKGLDEEIRALERLRNAYQNRIDAINKITGAEDAWGKSGLGNYQIIEDGLPLLKAEIAERDRRADALGREIEKTELLIGKMDDLKDKRIAAANKDAFDASEEARLIALDALAHAYNEGTLSIEAYIVESRKLVEQNRETTRGLSELQEVTQEFGHIGGSAFVDLTRQIVLAKGAAIDLHNVMLQLLADIVAAMARRYVVNPIVDRMVIGAGSGSVGGGGALPGGVGVQPYSLRPPGGAISGGTVGPGGAQPVIVQNFTHVSAADVPVLEAMGQRIGQRTVMAMRDARRRGGRL